MEKKGLLIVISGPSGAGKSTVCKALTKKNKFWISVSATTRAPRKGEVNGVNYYFLTEEDFKDKIKNNNFLEHAEVYGNYYGTPRSQVLKAIEEGKDVILEIDIQGALMVKEAYPEGVFVFILPPSMEELKKRIINRGSETSESFTTRFNSAYREINYVSKYNYVVINDTVDNAVRNIESIIMAEKCRVDRVKDEILNP
ncbi:Guanylate kinase [Clostridium luticellarii]|jgi:guanylate kinase|uniref:Guanylate kinase n=1 Tax=Clostridium luticellarii TaxID=1691940 RepID=A0A2T0BRI6_9CLOT|nr:Guanylate kinase [Clostridium luticellarii]